MAYLPRNYRKPDTWTVGGTLTVSSGGKLNIASGATISGLPKGAAVADIASGADTAAIVTSVNALLASLRTAGIIAESEA